MAFCAPIQGPHSVLIDSRTRPDPAVDGVVRWRVDLKLVIKERFGVDYHEREVSTLLKKLGFSHMSARPRDPAQDGEIVEAFKTISVHSC
ncbi:transposase [Mesorhizobium alhagi CCNWXJ12-2]|uniref:Transposase n=1 Tax=Mesorhizobium alhagi CCNWXJ12-2 TaxID=1107882 RepID=H0I2S9_9HYPH|nr:transposase [Mesorhizobium alhagi CCNWXJ12-2]